MREIAHLGAGFGEKLEVLGSSLLGSGFGSTGTLWDEMSGDESEHLIDKGLLLAGRFGRCVDDVGEVAGGVQSGFEADTIQGHVVGVGAFRVFDELSG